MHAHNPYTIDAEKFQNIVHNKYCLEDLKKIVNIVQISIWQQQMLKA